jgi:type I restriction enzyme, S subunit
VTPSTTVEAVCDLVVDCPHSTPQWTQDGVLVFRNHNIRSGQLDLSRPSFTTEAEYMKRVVRAVPSPGDIIITREAPMGEVALIPEGVRGCLGQRMVLLRPNSARVDERFLTYVLISAPVQDEIRVRGGTGSTVSNLRIPSLKSLPFWCPPLREQRAIATALSDVDALLGGLDRLIAKKRDLKQAAMQQLLTGQTRLPGFHETWKPRRFSELLTYERPDQYTVKNTDYEEQGDTPVLTANKSFVLGYTGETFGVFDSLPVIIFDDFTTDSKYVDFPFKVKSSAIKILKPRSPDANLKFVAERMQLLRFPVGEHKRYYISEYQHIELPTPAPDEQAAIATALSDMDAELAALNARRDKTRDLKRAIMQELLTGKTRRVPTGAVVCA